MLGTGNRVVSAGTAASARRHQTTLNHYPLQFAFKLIALAPQIRVTDASGRLILYVRQKAFRLRESVTVFSDEAQRNIAYTMEADRIIDVSATYTIRDAAGSVLGAVRREGLRSLWRSSFVVLNNSGTPVGAIREDNPWTKVLDGVVGEIPLIGWLIAMAINPTYTLEMDGRPMLLLRKKPSFFERHFEIHKAAEFNDEAERLGLAAIVMMSLLERGRG